MDGSRIVFLGAGRANVVVGLPITDIPNAPLSLRTSVPTQWAALRIRRAAQKECSECYRALKTYAGSRHVVCLESALYAAIEAVVPPKYLKLIEGATEATIVPNFTTNPASLLRMDVTPGKEPEPAAHYTVEVKPKGVWQQPQVIGIAVNGATYWIEEAKHRHCRYTQMRSYKEVRDSTEGEVAATVPAASPARSDRESQLNSPYCPNYLFRASLSSREGLRRLMEVPQNNLKVSGYDSSRALPHRVDTKTLTMGALDGVADAIDASDVLTPLSHLQLFGCAPPAKGEPADVVAAKLLPVLDVELLYRWSLAKDKDEVEWVVLPSNPAAHCSCVDPEANDRALNIGIARRVHPLLDFKTCVDRFYVSTTAKDVTLMISVSSLRGVPVASVPCSRFTDVPAEVGGAFVLRDIDVYRVGAVDLDDKRHKSLDHYYRHDRAIVETFNKSRVARAKEESGFH
ncbi:hypothetical protein ABL78_2934 [Leptomonas seymouri]|uniref:Inositol-pentakisphosphate 2-kinase n=1 Tax=Leptomonas seymouri TaxID=5684 RepID=A0A0N1PDW9_LEPSE|nr:hypothetical protein ABL78_2934 [Leptomonas seymouri]|eukprot:KPI87998.1 hypothetical protein ABL78_2934 [Leptomonas seymouri]